MVITQFTTWVKVFHSDNGREFVNRSLATLFQENGSLHQTCVYTPQQNSIVERKNPHILEVARALCFTMHVPKCFWADAFMTVVFLINRMPARVIDYQTPLRMLSRFHSIPYVLNPCLRIFGCIYYVHVHSHLRDKLDPHACVFWVTLTPKRAINVSTLLQGNTMSLWMFNSMSLSLIFLRMWTWFLLRGRLTVRKRKDCD